jgi:GGDEF domain-containing protein
VLAGDQPRFEFDYPFHSPLEDAWYTVEVLPLGEHEGGAVVTHTDVTARVTASLPHGVGNDLDAVTLLPTSPSAVKGLAQMLVDAQARGNALAVVTVTLTDLAEIASRHGRRSRDEVVVQVLARIRRLTRADDVIFRAATNQLVVVAAVADARSAEYLGERVSDALEAGYLVGADDIRVEVSVTVTASDQFSTLASLMPGSGTASERSPQDDAPAASSDSGRADVDVDVDASHLPLMVYSLPDGYLQAANETARSLFGLGSPGPERAHVRDIANPADLRHTIAAMSALSSGATDSYQAQRTLVTAEGPMALLTSVRRLSVGHGAVAVVVTVPVHPDEPTAPATEDPFSVALVAGTIDANGAVVSLSAPGSPMEIELVGALGESLAQCGVTVGHRENCGWPTPSRVGSSVSASCSRLDDGTIVRQVPSRQSPDTTRTASSCPSTSAPGRWPTGSPASNGTSDASLPKSALRTWNSVCSRRWTAE